MSRGVYKFAGIPVRVTTLYRSVHLMSSDYLCRDEEPLLSVETTAEDIAFERTRSAGDQAGEEQVAYADSYLETLAVYRKMATALVDFDVLLMHGSTICVDGRGVLFTALSGTGKSTHTRLWREMLGGRCVMVNDDKPLIRAEEDALLPEIYGTPWDGKHHLSNNIHCPLQAIVRLVRGERNEIREVSAQQIFPVLLQQTFCAPDPAFTSKVLSLVARLAEKVRFYELHCNMEPEAAEVAYAGIFDDNADRKDRARK